MAALTGLSAPVPLSAAHDISTFDCTEPALNLWLRQRALQNEGRFSRTYVVCQGVRVVAFVSIAAGAIERIATPSKLRRNAPDMIPVSVIARLAVDRAVAGRGLGADLLADALRRIASASQVLGIGAVLVHAKTDAAKRFYLRHAEFLEYPADCRILFLPIDTLLAAL
jgi:GNAT superfamily N-acetyltransferase